MMLDEEACWAVLIDSVFDVPLRVVGAFVQWGCTELAEGTSHSLEDIASWWVMNELTSLKWQKYFAGAPNVVFNSVYSIDTKYIYFLTYVAESSEGVQRV